GTRPGTRSGPGPRPTTGVGSSHRTPGRARRVVLPAALGAGVRLVLELLGVREAVVPGAGRLRRPRLPTAPLTAVPHRLRVGPTARSAAPASALEGRQPAPGLRPARQRPPRLPGRGRPRVHHLVALP